MLVSTHYMDEAERCHRLAYIAYGKLLAQGTAEEVVRQSGIHTWQVTGEDLAALADTLRGRPGVEMVAAFGASLHVSGTDADALRAAIAPFRDRAGTVWSEVPAGLEDAFIQFMQTAPGQRAMNGFSLVAASSRVLAKEFVQMRRDRVTFAMMVGVPIMQLVLFGFAINSDPKQLPTAVLDADPSTFSRSFIRAMQNTRLLPRRSTSSQAKQKAGALLETGRGAVPGHRAAGLLAQAAARRTAGAAGRGRRHRPGGDVNALTALHQPQPDRARPRSPRRRSPG